MTGLNIDLDDLLHPDEQQRFRRLCIPTTPSELVEQLEIVAVHLDYLREAANHHTDMETADRMAAVFSSLIGDGEGFDDDERALIRGAIEYFVLLDDADGDVEDPLGFDDDVRVLNSVLRRIDRYELAITFDE